MTPETKNLKTAVAEDFAQHQSAYLVVAADAEGFMQVKLQFPPEHLKVLRSMINRAIDEAEEATEMHGKLRTYMTDHRDD